MDVVTPFKLALLALLRSHNDALAGRESGDPAAQDRSMAAGDRSLMDESMGMDMSMDASRGMDESSVAMETSRSSEAPLPPPAALHTVSLVLIDLIKRLDAHEEPSLAGLLERLRSGVGENECHRQAAVITQTLAGLTSPDHLFSFFDKLRALLPGGPGADMFADNDTAGTLTPESVFGIFLRKMILGFDLMRFSQVARLFEETQRYVEGTAAATAPSRNMAERYLMEEAKRLASSQCASSDPDALDGRLNRMLDMTPNLPLTHYVKFLNDQRRGFFSQSLDNMHRFFDLQARSALEQRSAKGALGVLGQGIFHYATLSLAAMHAHFGHTREALRAVHETIRIAQENADPECLLHALGWLARLSDVASPIGHGPQQGRSASLAKLFVDSTAPKKGIEDLYAMARLGLSRELFAIGAPPVEVQQMLNAGYTAAAEHSHHDLLGMGQMLQAGLWDMYGHARLSTLHGQLMLQQAIDGSPTETCHALCQLALNLAAQGHMGQCDRVLAHAARQFPATSPSPAPDSKLVVITRCQIQHQSALYLRDWPKAAQIALTLCGHLQSMGRAASEGTFRRALLLREQGQYIPALRLVQTLLTAPEMLTSSQDPASPSLRNVKRVHLLLFKAEIEHEAGHSTQALADALQCMTMAKRHSLDTLRSLAALLVADIQLVLGFRSRAQVLLDSVYQHLLAHGGAFARGQAFLVRAKVLLACSNDSNSSSSSNLQQADRALDRAWRQFSTLSARRMQGQVAYLLATVNHSLGRTDKRNQFAAQYNRLSVPMR